MLVWDPAARPVAAELGRPTAMTAPCGLACCPTGGWSPAGTTGGCWCGTRPLRELAQSSWAATSYARCRTVAVLPDGRVVTGGDDGSGAGVGPGRSRRHPDRAGPPRRGTVATRGVAALPDGRVVTGGESDGRVLVWDPATPVPPRSSWAITPAG